MHTLQPSTKTETVLRTTMPPKATPTEPTLDIDTEHYESAKGCLMLSLLILASGVVCIAAGIGIHFYIEATIGS